MKEKIKLSLIVPCYNESGNVTLFYEAVKKAFENKIVDYEVIFINDGSKDATWKELKELYHNQQEVNPDAKIKLICFSRNFGKESAIYAGLRHAVGEYVTIIDADLQQRPEIVVDMVKKLEEEEEIDCVAAYQEKRREGKFLSFLKKCFYRLINRMSDVEFVSGASDFRTFRHSMVEAILEMPEYFRFSKGIFAWVGFETFYMPYVVEKRANGISKWSFWKLFKYAMEGILSFTTVPLRLATILGSVTSFAATIYLVVIVVQKLAFSVNVPGYTTIVGLILLFGGLQLLVLGIIGEYLAKLYVEGKRRPIYIAKQVITYENPDKQQAEEPEETTNVE